MTQDLFPGHRANRAAQKGIRNMWFTGPLYLGLVFAWGGFYHAEWMDGSLVRGALFAGLTMLTPVVMGATAIGTYRIMMSDPALARLARIRDAVAAFVFIVPPLRVLRLLRLPLLALDEWLDRASGDNRPLLRGDEKDRKCV